MNFEWPKLNRAWYGIVIISPVKPRFRASFIIITWRHYQSLFEQKLIFRIYIWIEYFFFVFKVIIIRYYYPISLILNVRDRSRLSHIDNYLQNDHRSFSYPLLRYYYSNRDKLLRKIFFRLGFDFNQVHCY